MSKRKLAHRPGGEWRPLRPLPADVRYQDTVTERVMLRAMPARPIELPFGNSGRLCVEAKFAESD